MKSIIYDEIKDLRPTNVPVRCQEDDCRNVWAAITITQEKSVFRCWYHWLQYYTSK